VLLKKDYSSRVGFHMGAVPYKVLDLLLYKVSDLLPYEASGLLFPTTKNLPSEKGMMYRMVAKFQWVVVVDYCFHRPRGLQHHQPHPLTHPQALLQRYQALLLRYRDLLLHHLYPRRAN
jgi:hypothetical protein